uniref:Uncharacterized protein n=1 Tax=Spumella elongata TaxID=89044 RepID=A0A7S3M6K3_9STRA|mmetsp:Transcript_36913/g.63726  ORF Transcript_36913/g.63726 Transcript_36913/m.63726 type:complete len:188 (+) Transcript_36913:119-682(+)|eukprot:CAMPEP_0184981572 /NCGR_PEP_ID=MMETSP1098-20130426/11225_1 /TAXON_ID=89044 /ORGANISM="Spumella elongata, Strain CCAP 955/1" /LENGTH=187 /DNA_ID=CAMNT_0027505139 /DNA_START=119 /DNA_END=682 /DNA_ORIENTATION=+
MLDKHKLFLYSGVTALATIFFIVAVSTYYWMHIKDTTDLGAFNSSNEGAKGYMTHCTSVMSQVECGYLHSLQVSAVLAILFGGVTSLFYLIPPRPFAAFPTFIAVTGNLCQMIFAIMTSVIFLYFKRNYYNDDGVNREYETPSSSSLSLDTSYWLWVTGTVLTFPLVVGGYYHLLHEHGQKKKALLP